MNLWVGIAMLAVAGILVIVGRPNKAGEHPKLLQFEAALVLYPPIVLVFLGLGAATIVSALLTK